MTHRFSNDRRFVGPFARLSAVVLSAVVTLLTLHGILRIAFFPAAAPVMATATTTAAQRHESE